jgi:hypothetical protein
METAQSIRADRNGRETGAASTAAQESKHPRSPGLFLSRGAETLGASSSRLRPNSRAAGRGLFGDCASRRQDTLALDAADVTDTVAHLERLRQNIEGQLDGLRTLHAELLSGAYPLNRKRLAGADRAIEATDRLPVSAAEVQRKLAAISPVHSNGAPSTPTHAPRPPARALRSPSLAL